MALSKPLRTSTGPATGYSCSDLACVCKNAAMLPVRELLSKYAAHKTTHLPDTPQGNEKAAAWTEAEVSNAMLMSCPRALSLQDFKTALIVIKPTSVDQATFALH